MNSMIIGLIGARGTVPTSEIATVSFLIDNKYLFECPSEIVQAFHKFQQQWTRKLNLQKKSRITALGKPTLGKISHIILSHLHFDHWGGLAHIVHRIMLLEKEKRTNEPLSIVIPKDSTSPFQQRMAQIFDESNLNLPLPDDEFFYRLLEIEVGISVRDVLRIIVVDDGESISLDSGYVLSTKKNLHISSGSFSYKLEFMVPKLNVERAKKLGIPFNRTLKRIEKSKGPIKIGDLQVTRSDIFSDNKTVLCYSGDTHVDSKLFSFFDNCHVLIHESTYLTQEEGYHLDSHSDIISLIEEAEKLSNLKILIPIHFSIRYTEEEISNCLSACPKKAYHLVNPIEDIIVQIDSEDNITVLKRSN